MPREAISCTRVADVGVADLGLAVRAVGVAVVDDLEVVEDLDPEVEVVGAGLVGQRPDRPRAEPGAGPVRGGDVERRPDDRDVGLPRVELLGIGEERALAERADAAEHVSEVELLPHPGGERTIGRWSIGLGHRAHTRPKK